MLSLVLSSKSPKFKPMAKGRATTPTALLCPFSVSCCRCEHLTELSEGKHLFWLTVSESLFYGSLTTPLAVGGCGAGSSLPQGRQEEGRKWTRKQASSSKVHRLLGTHFLQPILISWHSYHKAKIAPLSKNQAFNIQVRCKGWGAFHIQT